MADFCSSEVARCAGVTLRQLQWWDENGIVSPRKTGHRRQYTTSEVVVVSVIRDLREKGLSIQRIRGFVRSLRLEVTSGRMAFLVTDGRSAWFPATAMEAMSKAAQLRRPSTVIDIGRHALNVLAQAKARKVSRSTTSQPG